MINNNKRTFLFHAFFLFSFFLISYKIIYKLNFWQIPLIILLITLPIAIKSREKSILMFLFFLPIISSTAKFFDFGYPFNYMVLPLFFLSFISLIALIKGELKIEAQNWQIPYLLFLTTLFISSLFLWLRWINFPYLHNINADLFVSPDGNRISFASIFPIISLALFSIAPYIKFLISSKKIKWNLALKMLQCGFLVSITIALYQKILNPDFMAKKYWTGYLKRVNGGFSDFNSLGTFSGLMFFLTIMAIIKSEKFIIKKQIINLISMLSCITGIVLSGCRSALLIMILSLLSIFIVKRPKFKTIFVITIIIPLSCLLIYKSNLPIKNRILGSIASLNRLIKDKDIESLNSMSNGRVKMFENSLKILEKFPLCGIGNGNFIFYQRHIYFGKKFLDDTPLNQYLHIGVENGIISLILFIIAFILLIKVQKAKDIKILLLIISIIFMVNNFLWFPEMSVLFWFLASSEQKEEGKKSLKLIDSSLLKLSIILLIAIIILAHIIKHKSLLPMNWSLERGLPNNRYGFWSYEKDKTGEYMWSKQKAGIALNLDNKGNSKNIEFIVSAPLTKLPKQKQTLQFYWKGKHYKTMNFKENRTIKFKINGKPNDSGYLEVECLPSFIPSKIFDGNKDNRRLGIRLKLYKDKKERYLY